MVRRRRELELDQAEATRKAKEHPKAVAAFRRLEQYVHSRIGDRNPLDPRPWFSESGFDPEWSRLSEAYREVWSEIRERYMEGLPVR